ncbi:MAG: GntR family transcriptional regulator, partial [Betaproteobacteria bacterium]|nr:GntR family transcriptional regulator [Betaproteobacteria bacterium]
MLLLFRQSKIHWLLLLPLAIFHPICPNILLSTRMKQQSAAKKPAPRYQAIADVLRDAIARGRYKVGSRLPTEHWLCQMFDASRHTVREALRTLTEEQLIVRRPRAGSKIIAAHSPTIYAQSVTSMEQLLNYPETWRKTLTSRRVRADA